MGSIPGSVIGAGVNLAASKLGGKGGSVNIPSVRVPNILAGGFSSYLAEDDSQAVAGYLSDMVPTSWYAGNPVREAMYNQSLQRKAAIDALRSGYFSQADEFRGSIPRFEQLFGDYSGRYGDMLGMVAPGMGRLTDARVQAIENARERERSNLRASLNKRRVLGSSFADNALNRQALEFAQEEERARAQSFMEELDLTQKLTADQLKIDTANIQTSLDMTIAALEAEQAAENVTISELNMFAQMAQNMASAGQQAAQVNANNALQAAQMQAQSASGRGLFVGNLLGSIGGPLQSAVAGFGASRGVWGGYDPSTGITWNSGRVV